MLPEFVCQSGVMRPGSRICRCMGGWILFRYPIHETTYLPTYQERQKDLWY